MSTTIHISKIEINMDDDPTCRARGAIPLAHPYMKPFVITGTFEFPAAIEATWLKQISYEIRRKVMLLKCKIIAYKCL